MECQICLDRYESPERDPKVLRCGHTFCSRCICSMSGLYGSVSCPTCRTESAAADIHVNYGLRDALLGSQVASQWLNTTGVVVPVTSPTVAPVIVAPSEEELFIDMKLSVESTRRQVGDANSMELMVSLVPPEGAQRTPCDICCVVDVSDSMAREASIQDSTGQVATHRLNVLDIVKHALRTIVHTLNDNDRLAVVVFATNSNIAFDLTSMTPEGKRAAEQQLDALRTDGGMTNLWRGLETGINIMDAFQEPGRLQHLMLLTDGVPTWNPPRGIKQMLKRLRETKEQKGSALSCTISTFGFGYELDSQMLKDIAIIGGGTYAFIPDAGFVGTTFVNAMTNLLVTMATNVTITLEPLSGTSFPADPVLGGHPSKKTFNRLEIDLGSLQFGQRRDIIVRVLGPSSAYDDFMQVTLRCNTRAENKDMLRVGQTQRIRGLDVLEFDLEPQRCRLIFVDGVRQAMEMMKLTSMDKVRGLQRLPEVQQLVQALAAHLSGSREASSEAMQALIEDVTGQVAEACSREDWYTKWGVHYLPSLMCAHLAQQCNNFKDPGVQHYGGDLFSNLRDQADEIFCSLPPPTASLPPPAPAVIHPTTENSRRVTPGPRVAAVSAAVDMAVYYDRYAG